MSLRILFVLRSAAHLPHQTTTIDQLIERSHEVTLLYGPSSRPDEGRMLREWLAGRHNVTVGQAIARSGWGRAMVRVVRMVRGRISSRWAAAIERRVPPDRAIVASLRAIEPDCVVVSPGGGAFDAALEYVKAARAAGIPSIVPGRAEAGDAAALAVERLVAGSTPSDIAAAVRSDAIDQAAPPPSHAADAPPTASRILQRTIDKARRKPIYRHYEHVRDLVLRMMDDEAGYGYSTYWKQEVRGFEYLFDASPLIIASLREHAYHFTGLKSYEYRKHHAHNAVRFASKLKRLAAVDARGLFVPESPALGGFGHRIGGRMVNLDTLRFYECLIALDRGGVVGELRTPGRKRILEIGAGWGGFAYNVKTLFPDTTYIIVDLPPTILFAATYLKATFPDARMAFYGERPDEYLFDDLDGTDFLFLPAHAFARLPVPVPDLAVNICSFQEMTTAQVAGYVQKLADSGCCRLYSLNRDRSRYNHELSTVTSIMETRYRVERIEVLDVPYTVLGKKRAGDDVLEETDYRHQIGRC